MSKVISFSLYGDSPKYTTGLLKNIELAKKFYPDWLLYVYYDDTVPVDFIKSLTHYDKVVTFDCTGMNFNKLCWRFFVKDVERFIVRDTDSRINEREKKAVDEWIKSKKRLHIMRDHPHHKYVMLGGMWGFIPDGYSIKKQFMKWENIKERDKELTTKMVDMDFLAQVIYPEFKNDALIHDSVKIVKDNSISFPTKMQNSRFVGEIFDENNKRAYQHKLWKERIEL